MLVPDTPPPSVAVPVRPLKSFVVPASRLPVPGPAAPATAHLAAPFPGSQQPAAKSAAVAAAALCHPQTTARLDAFAFLATRPSSQGTTHGAAGAAATAAAATIPAIPVAASVSTHTAAALAPSVLGKRPLSEMSSAAPLGEAAAAAAVPGSQRGPSFAAQLQSMTDLDDLDG